MKLVTTLLTTFCFLLGVPTLLASHIRGGTLSYKVTDAASRTVQFKMRLGLRALIGDTFFLNFGDGQTAAAAPILVASGLTDSAGNTYSMYEFTYDHTYGAGATSFIAYFQLCCRISTLAYQNDQNIRLETNVNFSDPTPPTVNFPAIIQFYQNQVNSLDLKTFINDSNSDGFTCRKATNAESGFDNVQKAPLTVGQSLAVSSSCELTWDLSAFDPSGFPKYAVGIMIVSAGGAKVPFDFIVELIDGTPFTCEATGSLSLSGYPGDSLSTTFQVSGGPTGTTASLVTTTVNQKGAVLPSATAAPLPTTYTFSYIILAGDTDFSTLIQWQVGAQICVRNIQVTVLQNRPPVALCQNVAASADANCEAIVTTGQVDNGSSDPEASALAYSLSPGGPFNLGNTGVTLTVTDVIGATATCTATVSVTDTTAPTATCVDYILVPINAAFNIRDSVSDNCDSAPVVTQSVDTKDTPGVYIDAVTLSATDAAGKTGECTLPMLVVYDPSAGFVTGGGWIDSPVGAYSPDTTIVGKASFGFVSKYKKGQTIPDGNTQFSFTAGKLSFHSTVYEWLVVTGLKCAKYKGSGLVNGETGYGFMLTACDVAEPGTGVDTFRIKIWKTSDNSVVYDNQMGVGDDSYTGTKVNGNIQVHLAKKRLLRQ